MNVVNAMGEMQEMVKDRAQTRPWGKYISLPVILIILFAFPVVRPPLFFLTLFFSVFMYVGLTESWNLLGGYTGYVSLGHIAFFSVGAYTTAVFMNRLGASPFATAILGGVFAAILAALVGYPVLRL